MIRIETPSTARSGFRRKDVLKSFTRSRISTAGGVSAIGSKRMNQSPREATGNFPLNCMLLPGAQILAMLDQKDPAAAMEALKGIEGVKFETKQEVTVTVK